MKSFKQFITESNGSKCIVITFGRFQPPTVGHELLLDKVASIAKGEGCIYRIYASRSNDSKKNPLVYEDKIRFMRKMFPRHGRSIILSEFKTIFEIVGSINAEGFKNLTMVVGSDRVDEFKKLLDSYNGKLYNFDTIELVSAGERDPDADDVSGMSASKMRAAVKADDYTLFLKGLPTDFIEHGRELFDAIRKGMGIMESMSIEEIRSLYLQKKIFNVNEQVMSKTNPEYKLTVTERYSNYVRCSDNKKYFVKDLIPL